MWVLGVAVTVYALASGLMSMKNGDAKKSQYYMRLRIAGQGFTVIALFIGGMLAGGIKK